MSNQTFRMKCSPWITRKWLQARAGSNWKQLLNSNKRMRNLWGSWEKTGNKDWKKWISLWNRGESLKINWTVLIKMVLNSTKIWFLNQSKSRENVSEWNRKLTWDTFYPKSLCTWEWKPNTNKRSNSLISTRKSNVCNRFVSSIRSPLTPLNFSGIKSTIVSCRPNVHSRDRKRNNKW